MRTSRVWRLRLLCLAATLLLCGRVRADTNQFCFPVGEEIFYRMYWGVFPVGEVKISSSWVQEEGRDLLAIRMTVCSGDIISRIYPVEDFLESVIDPQTFLPVRYTQKLREGKRVRDETTVFDHAAGKAFWKSALDGSAKELTIGADTRDMLCFAYHMRSKGFDVGRTETFCVLVDDKLYDLTVTGIKYEKVYLSNFGEVKCLRLEPKAKFGEIYVRKGTVDIWFSEDSRRMCAKTVFNVPVAVWKIKAILRSVKGPGEDFWTRGGE